MELIKETGALQSIESDLQNKWPDNLVGVTVAGELHLTLAPLPLEKKKQTGGQLVPLSTVLVLTREDLSSMEISQRRVTSVAVRLSKSKVEQLLQIIGLGGL